jgi:prophage regulatory protein
MSKSTNLTLKIIGDQDFTDVFPKTELTLAQRELIAFVAKTAVEEYIKHQKPTPPSNVFDRIIKISEVMKLTGLGRTSIYAYIKNGSFPKQIKLGIRSSGWKESQKKKWIEDQKD